MEKYKKILIKIATKKKKLLLKIFEFEGMISSKWVSAAHERLFWAEWCIPKTPEFFDHNLDLYYQWRKYKEPYWLERGIYGLQALKMFDEPVVLELGCGDGFNACNFYSTSAKSIVSCDFDKSAIKTAKKKNQAENVEFILADIRTKMPDIKECTNVVWDASIEHFTESEIENIMKQIKTRLQEKQGILSGHTIVEKADGKKSLYQHKYEFKNMADLKRFLTPYFKNVLVFETIYKSRHNLYFYASDGDIPFSNQWKHKV